MMVYEDTAERHRFDSFCKVVLRHEMLDLFSGIFLSKQMAGISALFAASRLWTASVRQISTPAIT